MHENRFYKKLKKDTEGSFTIEASIIFPILIILVLCFVFFSLVIYEKVTLQYEANKIASQLAHSWGSSTMDIDTGKVGKNDYVTKNGDGLYWRLTSNEVLSKFAPGMGDNGVVLDKKSRADKYLNRYNGQIEFDNGLFTQKIKVSLDKNLSLPKSVSNLFGINKLEVTASHPIIEQTEIIRNTDFMLYGFDKFTGYAAEYIPFFNRKEE